MIKDIFKKKSKRGFTLAEVLITLVIIGVVTALTIPSLLSSVSEKTYDAKRQGFATRMAQAISQIGMLNAYEADGDEQSKIDNSTMNFLVEALSKVYSITQICEFENYKACDFPDYTMPFWGQVSPTTTKDLAHWKESAAKGLDDPSKLGGLDPKAAAFRTKNGESVMIYYNPRCIAEQEIQPDTAAEVGMTPGTKNFVKEVCLNMIYDLDGAKKGPNALGKDMGYAIVLYPDTPYFVIFNGVAHNGPSTVASKAADNSCQSMSAYSYAKGQWELPTREQMYAVALNLGWSGMYTDTIAYGNLNLDSWTSSLEGSGDDDYGWVVSPMKKVVTLTKRDTPTTVICVAK